MEILATLTLISLFIGATGILFYAFTRKDGFLQIALVSVVVTLALCVGLTIMKDIEDKEKVEAGTHKYKLDDRTGAIKLFPIPKDKE